MQFSDGCLFGTVCCMSDSPPSELRERDSGYTGVNSRPGAEHI